MQVASLSLSFFIHKMGRTMACISSGPRQKQSNTMKSFPQDTLGHRVPPCFEGHWVILSFSSWLFVWPPRHLGQGMGGRSRIAWGTAQLRLLKLEHRETGVRGGVGGCRGGPWGLRLPKRDQVPVSFLPASNAKIL